MHAMFTVQHFNFNYRTITVPNPRPNTWKRSRIDDHVEALALNWSAQCHEGYLTQQHALFKHSAWSSPHPDSAADRRTGFTSVAKASSMNSLASMPQPPVLHSDETVRLPGSVQAVGGWIRLCVVPNPNQNSASPFQFAKPGELARSARLRARHRRCSTQPPAPHKPHRFGKGWRRTRRLQRKHICDRQWARQLLRFVLC